MSNLAPGYTDADFDVKPHYQECDSQRMRTFTCICSEIEEELADAAEEDFFEE